MDLEKTNNNSMIIKYQNTDNVLEDITNTLMKIYGIDYYLHIAWIPMKIFRC